MATKPEFLVAKDEMLVALATVLVVISSPAGSKFYWLPPDKENTVQVNKHYSLHLCYMLVSNAVYDNNSEEKYLT